MSLDLVNVIHPEDDFLDEVVIVWGDLYEIEYDRLNDQGEVEPYSWLYTEE